MKTLNPLTTQRLASVGLNWDVQLQSLWVDDTFGPRKVEHRAVVRQDNGLALGVVGKRYTPVQNYELASLAEAVESSTDAKFSSGGSFEGGALVYMSLRLPKDIKVDGRDTLETYLVMSNPHDGSGSARVFVTTIRPVCKNTLALGWSSSLQSIFERLSLRHTKGITGKLADVRANLSDAFAAVSEFERRAQALRNTKPTERMVDEFIRSLGFSTDEAEGKKREDEMAFRRLLIDAPGQDLAGNSMWRLVNGATYYADHAKEYRKGTDKGFVTQFGSMAEWKTKALDKALVLSGIK